MSWVRTTPVSDSVDVSHEVHGSRKISPLRECIEEWIGDLNDLVKRPRIVSDVLAGMTVAAVALPLNLALAVAAGLPPSVGVISGAIGGIVAAFFGSSRWQVTGPAAALNVMVAAIVAKFGASGAAAAAIIVGVVCIVISILGLGKWMAKVPEAVIAGFTTGVGLKLLDQQLPHLMGVNIDVVDLITTLNAPEWLQQVSWNEVLCGIGVIFTILSMKSFPKVPAALFGLTVVTFISDYLGWELKHVGSMTAELPAIHFPNLAGKEWSSLLLLSLPLAFLGATESLLSARVIDRLEPKAKPHHSNLELLGQGLANIVVGLFSGSTVTGVVVRSTVNIQSGGKTKLAAVFHGVVLMIALLYFSESLAKVPVAALAGLLCLIGFRLVEGKELVHLVQTKPVQAAAFGIAMVGTLNDKLFFGLITAIAIAVVSQRISDRLKESEEFADHSATPGLRAVIESSTLESKRHEDWRIYSAKPHEDEPWIRHVSETPWIHPSSYVHPNATLIGRIFIERGVHVAAETSVRADEGTPFFIGNRTNLQDGVVLHALKGKHVEVQGKKWAIYIDEQVSVAHQALIHGPCYVGAQSFVGFKAIVHDAVVGEHCFVGIGSVVVGVKVPDGRFVPHGMIVDTQEKANVLPPATEAHHEFNEDVVDVNQGLAQAYHWRAIQENKEQMNRKENKWNYSSLDSQSESDSPSYF